MKKASSILFIVFMLGVFVYSAHAQGIVNENDLTPTVEVEIIEVPEGIITIRKVENISLLDNDDFANLQSQTYFTDGLSQTCGSGAQFNFTATGPGNVSWRINWSSGWHGNVPYCSSSQCSYTITTDWSAFYTDAWASVSSPQTLWGPGDAYKCR